MKLIDKVSLVTGAGQGIGKAIALQFAREGSKVIVNDIDLTKANTVAAEINNKLNQEALPIKADVSQSKEAEAMIAASLGTFGKIDILVNNAGVQTETPFLELTEEEWQRIIDVNLKGTFICSQIVARRMVKQGGGKIIDISSVHQFLPRRNIAHYAASKGGIMMLSKVMALELARYKINVNCIAPGVITTPMNQVILNSPGLLSETSSQIPWERIGKPEEVAEVALFLASKEADYITGTTVYIDGGLSLVRLSGA